MRRYASLRLGEILIVMTLAGGVIVGCGGSNPSPFANSGSASGEASGSAKGHASGVATGRASGVATGRAAGVATGQASGGAPGTTSGTACPGASVLPRGPSG